MDKKLKLVSIFKNTFVELGDRDDEYIISCSKGDIASWDSGNHFMLITCIEEDFGVVLPDETIVYMNSFLDVYRAIEELDE
jgi:acyl carrier protein